MVFQIRHQSAFFTIAQETGDILFDEPEDIPISDTTVPSIEVLSGENYEPIDEPIQEEEPENI